MSPAQLESDLRAFAAHLLSPLLEDGKNPSLKWQAIKDRPLTIRVGVRIAGVDPDLIQAICSDGKAIRAAWLKQWPVNTSGARDAKSVAIAGDDRHVLMDLIFFTLQLDTPESLTPSAS